ncbi:MAG: MBL fold metallo-hydrolase [Armatimonadota bacterium]
MGRDWNLEQVTSGVYALAVWDESWNSFNDCYVVVRENRTLLVDSGKAEHAAILADALRKLGKRTDDVVVLLATHGHGDHVGGAGSLARATRSVHEADWGLLDETLRGQFRPNVIQSAEALGFECVLLGQHTSGSVALYDPHTKALFCGDHVCFFGRPLSGGRLVGEGAELREAFRDFVHWWSGAWSNGETRKQLEEDLARRGPEDQERYNLHLFLDGVRTMRLFDALSLCTGHGSVLQGDINGFLSDLLAAGERPL